MDFIGNIIDWIIQFVINCSGATADELKISNDQLALLAPIWDTTIILGIGLTLIYFLYEVNNVFVFQQGSFTLKSILVPFVKLCIAVALMSQAGNIFGMIAGWNNGFADFCEGISGEGLTLKDGVDSIGKTVCDSLDFWTKIAMLFPLLMSLLVTWLCRLVWVYKAFLYKVELIVRVMFGCVAMSDVYSGQNSNAIRYLKGSLALVIYGGMLILLPKLVIGLAITDFGTFQDELIAATAGGGDMATGIFDVIMAFLKLIIAPVAAIGVTSAAKQVTKEALGA